MLKYGCQRIDAPCRGPDENDFVALKPAFQHCGWWMRFWHNGWGRQGRRVAGQHTQHIFRAHARMDKRAQLRRGGVAVIKTWAGKQGNGPRFNRPKQRHHTLIFVLARKAFGNNHDVGQQLFNFGIGGRQVAGLGNHVELTCLLQSSFQTRLVYHTWGGDNHARLCH